MLPSAGDERTDGGRGRRPSPHANRCDWRTINPRRRAALPVGPTPRFEASLDKRRRKEWARQRRRLEERGRLEATVVVDGAAESRRFWRSRQRGWKGARGTALGADAARAAFTREMLGRFAARGQLAVHSLALDGEPIAIGLVLRSGARAFYWKTAYDERFAEYSPGLQLTLDLSRRLEREPGLTLINSCAISDYPMIDTAVARAARCSPISRWRCTPARRAASRWGLPRRTPSNG